MKLSAPGRYADKAFANMEPLEYARPVVTVGKGELYHASVEWVMDNAPENRPVVLITDAIAPSALKCVHDRNSKHPLPMRVCRVIIVDKNSLHGIADFLKTRVWDDEELQAAYASCRDVRIDGHAVTFEVDDER